MQNNIPQPQNNLQYIFLIIAFVVAAIIGLLKGTTITNHYHYNDNRQYHMHETYTPPTQTWGV